MPSPGASIITTGISSVSFTLEQRGSSVSFNPAGEFPLKLGNAMHTGWTSISPSTVTTMIPAFTAEFATYMVAGGYGKIFMIDAVATGIDAEVAQWAGSWQSIPQVHTYAPTALSIKNTILGLYSGPHSNGVIAICTAIGNTFAQYFVVDPGIGSPA